MPACSSSPSSPPRDEVRDNFPAAGSGSGAAVRLSAKCRDLRGAGERGTAPGAGPGPAEGRPRCGGSAPQGAPHPGAGPSGPRRREKPGEIPGLPRARRGRSPPGPADFPGAATASAERWGPRGRWSRGETSPWRTWHRPPPPPPPPQPTEPRCRAEGSPRPLHPSPAAGSAAPRLLAAKPAERGPAPRGGARQSRPAAPALRLVPPSFPEPRAGIAAPDAAPQREGSPFCFRHQLRPPTGRGWTCQLPFRPPPPPLSPIPPPKPGGVSPHLPFQLHRSLEY